MMKKILITGANGFLGQHLGFFLCDDFDVIATGKGPRRLAHDERINYIAIDLTDAEAIKKMLDDTQPHIIIHTAAMSKPDECEANREACIAANVNATRNLLLDPSVHFIYTSTDFIFGEGGPHAEDDATNPLNFYGETKLRAEQLVHELAPLHTIVRPVFIYGKQLKGMRGSFLQWVEQSLKTGKRINVVSDQLRTPTYVLDICKGIKTIIEEQRTGVYHLAGSDILSPYEMALATATVLGLDASLINKVNAESFPEVVKRAKQSGLKIDRAKTELNYKPVPFEEGVRLSFD